MKLERSPSLAVKSRTVAADTVGCGPARSPSHASPLPMRAEGAEVPALPRYRCPSSAPAPAIELQGLAARSAPRGPRPTPPPLRELSRIKFLLGRGAGRQPCFRSRGWGGYW